MSIYYAWVLAGLFSAFLGWGVYHVVDGFLKEQQTHPEWTVGGYVCASAVAGLIFFFIFLAVTGAPANNLDKYYVSGASVLWLGFGVPLLLPVVGAALAAITFVAMVVLRRLRVRLNNLGVRLHTVGATARLMLESASDYRAALEHVREQRALTHQPVVTRGRDETMPD